ncbi:566_t:CDS:10, partial [Paraglomus brasilianum]
MDNAQDVGIIQPDPINIIQQEPEIVYAEICRLLEEITRKDEQIKGLENRIEKLSTNYTSLHDKVEQKNAEIKLLEDQIEEELRTCTGLKKKLEEANDMFYKTFEAFQKADDKNIEESEKTSAYIKKLEDQARVTDDYVATLEIKNEKMETLLETRENELNALHSQMKLLTNNQRGNFASDKEFVSPSNSQTIYQKKKPLSYAHNQQIIDIVSTAMDKIMNESEKTSACIKKLEDQSREFASSQKIYQEKEPFTHAHIQEIIDIVSKAMDKTCQLKNEQNTLAIIELNEKRRAQLKEVQEILDRLTRG